MKKLDSPQIFPGLLCIFAGVYCGAISVGIIPGEVHGPRWVMSLVGLVFFLAGIVLFRGKSLSNNSLVASLMLTCFSLVGFGVGFFTDIDIVSKIIFGISSMTFLILSIIVMNNGKKSKKD